jgi:hypothetical protein
VRVRKKPVEVEAFHFDGSGQAHADSDDWAQDLVDQGRAHRPAERPSGAIFEGDYTGLYIYTLEGRMHASPGDWIICGVKGEFYACKPDVFAETYEQVDSECSSCHARDGHPHTDYCPANEIRRAAFNEAIAKVSAAPDDFPVPVSVIKALLTEVRDAT